MDSYEVLITPDAMDMLDSAADYIAFTLDNPEAADMVYDDAIDTANRLEYLAGSMGYCKTKALADMGYRRIFLKKHDYVLLYKIYGNVAVVEAVFHQKQDYENKFAKKF